jgi:hypothetical protein
VSRAGLSVDPARAACSCDARAHLELSDLQHELLQARALLLVHQAGLRSLEALAQLRHLRLEARSLGEGGEAGDVREAGAAVCCLQCRNALLQGRGL